MESFSADLLTRDLSHIWHPCMQMKDFEHFEPLLVRRAYGSIIELTNGHTLIDAVSSWWCKSLGHRHPRLQAALCRQLERFEQVMLCNLTNDVIINLSERLATLSPNLTKVSYAGDGSSAVEMAMKMSLHAQAHLGQQQRTLFMALNGAYHGETCATLAVSDLALYKQPYQALMPPAVFLKDIPYVSGPEDPLWHDCAVIWPQIEQQLDQHATQLAAIIVEPILQGAGGMLVYSQDFLKRLRQWTQEQGIFLIADEIMTGLGRTGLPLACQHAAIEPDFLCIAKGLTAGYLPLSAVLTSKVIFDLFYDDYETGKAFMHSHTHSGNTLAAAVALECLQVLEDEHIYARVQQQGVLMRQLMTAVAEETGKLHNLRGIGMTMAADLVVPDNSRWGHRVFQKAIALGALLRPLGNTIYWMPPLNIEEQELYRLQCITEEAIAATVP